MRFSSCVHFNSAGFHIPNVNSSEWSLDRAGEECHREQPIHGLQAAYLKYLLLEVLARDMWFAIADSSILDQHDQVAGEAAAAPWTSAYAEFQVSGLEGSSPDLGVQKHHHCSIASTAMAENAVPRSHERRNLDRCVKTGVPNMLSSAAAATACKTRFESKDWRSFPFLRHFVGSPASGKTSPEVCQSSNPLSKVTIP